MIQRDGANPSLWQKTSLRFIATNKPDKKTVYDVIIVGGGITGVTTGLLLQQAGLKCLLMEARNLCFGTTGGTTAHLNTLLDTPYSTIEKNFSGDTATLVAQAAQEALLLIKKNIDSYSIDCEYEACDAFLFSQEEKQSTELKEIIQATSKAGIGIYSTAQIPVPIPFTQAAKITGQAKFHPLKYVYGVANAFEEKGGIILQQCRALGVNEISPAEVHTSKGLFKSRYVIYATHMPTGVNLVHLRCQPFRTYAMAVTLKNKAYPKRIKLRHVRSLSLLPYTDY